MQPTNQFKVNNHCISGDATSVTTAVKFSQKAQLIKFS